ncbi:glycoside hydrolase family 104 protein [Tenacibaculum maritimum]|uniref:glycoside hydrolase family 24 protein n=3 Tax=Tenacibaculum maritimum TaxID=107401 RepID=UPI003BF49A17
MMKNGRAYCFSKFLFTVKKKQVAPATRARSKQEKQPARKFPNTDMVYHFHPIGFVNQMKLIYGGGNGLGVCYGEARVRAFMRMLRIGEGTKDEKGYERIVGGTHFSDHGKDFSGHPNVKVYISSIEDYSYAAGAYQITQKNWNDTPFVNWRKKKGLSDFSPESQDKYCLYLLADKKKSLDLIKQGDITEAIRKCRKEWASLPGSGHGQREENLFEILAEYTKYYKEELNGITTLKMPWGTAKQLGYDCCSDDDNDTSCGKENIDLSNRVPWMSQFNKDEAGNREGCFRTSKKLLMKSGLPDSSGKNINPILIVTEDSEAKTISINNQNAIKGIEYIDSELEKGNPVLVGLHYNFTFKKNTDKTTDHFFIIKGRGCENNKRYFSFYEVGTNYGDKGIHPMNKLFLEEDNTLRGTSKYKPSHKYIVSQVRKN